MSLHFARRAGKTKALHAACSAWPKLTAIVHSASHLILGYSTCRGPSQDSPELAPALRDAARRLVPFRLLADKAYDARSGEA